MKKSLRIIVASCGTSTKSKVIQKTLAQFRVSYCTIVYFNKKFSIKNCDHIRWLKINDLIYSKYPTQWDTCIPIDDLLLRKLAFCETLTLQMMNRLDWDNTISYNERKEMYLNHVRFWNNEIIKNKINIVVFLGIPHEMFDFVLYNICKIYSIPIIMLESGRHRDTTLLFHDYEKSMVELSKKNNKLPEISKEFMKKMADFSYLKMPLMSVVKWRVYEIFSYLKEIITSIFVHPEKIIIRLCNPLFWLHRFKSILHKQLLKLYYWKISIKPDYSKKFVYVALHYQPECTTSPLAGIFVNQELIVHMLHQAFPKDVMIYVKEHPLPSYTLRSYSFYKSMMISPRVIFIRTNTDSIKLIEHSVAVATATGTVGWETLVGLKPLLMFGFEYFQYGPNVFQISTMESCKTAVDKIIRHEYTSSIDDLNLFYRTMLDVFIDGYIDEFYKPYTFLSDQKNIDNISLALIRAIKNTIHTSQ